MILLLLHNYVTVDQPFTIYMPHLLNHKIVIIGRTVVRIVVRLGPRVEVCFEGGIAMRNLVTAMDRMFVSCQNLCVETYCQCDGIRTWGLWEILRL